MEKDFLNIAIQAAQAGGEIAKKSFTGGSRVSYKDMQNVVTETDLASEKLIIETIQSEFPDHNIFSEEARWINKSSEEYAWIIDPLDGTTNFSREFQYFCVSVALWKGKDQVVGVVLAPMFAELFTAQVGSGAQLNGKDIKVSETKDIEKCVVAVNRAAVPKEKERYTAIISVACELARTIRATGSSALDMCYMAAGRFEATIFNGCNCYDAAAGILIAKEAGAVVSDFSGAPWSPDIDGSQDLLIATPEMQQQWIQVLKDK